MRLGRRRTAGHLDEVGEHGKFSVPCLMCLSFAVAEILVELLGSEEGVLGSVDTASSFAKGHKFSLCY